MSLRPKTTPHLFTLDEHNNPVPAKSIEAWLEWLVANFQTRHVAYNELDDGVRVSTIFLGVDSSIATLLDPTAKPPLWETMILGGPQHGYQVRYTSHADALSGHRLALWRAENPLIQEPPE